MPTLFDPIRRSISMRRPERRATAYQLLIEVATPIRRSIGRLGRFAFPAGL